MGWNAVLIASFTSVNLTPNLNKKKSEKQSNWWRYSKLNLNSKSKNKSAVWKMSSKQFSMKSRIVLMEWKSKSCLSAKCSTLNSQWGRKSPRSLIFRSRWGCFGVRTRTCMRKLRKSWCLRKTFASTKRRMRIVWNSGRTGWTNYLKIGEAMMNRKKIAQTRRVSSSLMMKIKCQR